MKVRCKSCGKRFDPEKTNYMCPKCGSWYVEKKSTAQSEYDPLEAQSSERDETRYDSQDDTQYSYTDTEPDTPQAEPEYKTSSTERQSQTGGSKRNTKTLIVIVCAAIIGLVSGIVSLVDSYKIDSGNGYYENDWEADDEDEDDAVASYLYEGMTVGNGPAKMVTGCTVGTPIEVTDISGESGWWCTVLSVEKTQMAELEIPGGYQLYQIDYQVTNVEGDQLQWDDRDGYMSCDLMLRIRTKSGVILSPFGSYELSEIENESDSAYAEKDIADQIAYWSDYTDENYIDSDINENRGKLLFLVREGDFDRIVMYNSYEGEDGYDIENIYVFAGEKAQEAENSDSDCEWIASGKTENIDAAYSVSSNVYIQKIEKDAVFTPDQGVNIRCRDLLGEENLEMLDRCKDNEDWYLMALRMTNNSSVENSYPYVHTSYYSDVYSQIDFLSYSPARELGDVPPMTTATLYYVVHVEKGYSGNIFITYSNVNKDKKMVDSEITVTLP